MSNLTVYEAGMRSPEGNYSKFIVSPSQKEVDDYILIMKDCTPEGFELVKLEKYYELKSTTPHLVAINQNKE